MLNRNTFFALTEINHHFKTESRCHIIYGDNKNTEEAVDTAGLSYEEFEEILKGKVAYGLTLVKEVVTNDDDRAIPFDIVEAHKYVEYDDDGF